MDHLRVLLVPFHATSLIMVGIFSILFSLFDLGGLYGIIASLLVQIWVLKYCYVIIEHIADGAREPPVMSGEMLSPTELRPWVQLGIVIGGYLACQSLGGNAGVVLAVVLLALLPASIALLGMGEPFYQALNPLMLSRLVRGLGPYYLLILASVPVYLGIIQAFGSMGAWSPVQHAVRLICEISFFNLIGGCIYLRRRQLGFVPARSPERTAAREEAERAKSRDHMLDEVFQQVRIGKHVEATRPLAAWLGTLDGDTMTRDAQFIASQAAGWGFPASLNTIGSTLIRHLLRAGQPEAALSTFEYLRAQSPTLTLDSVDDLRTLIDIAEGGGRDELAASLRLETPIYRR